MFCKKKKCVIYTRNGIFGKDNICGVLITAFKFLDPPTQKKIKTNETFKQGLLHLLIQLIDIIEPFFYILSIFVST